MREFCESLTQRVIPFIIYVRLTMFLTFRCIFSLHAALVLFSLSLSLSLSIYVTTDMNVNARAANAYLIRIRTRKKERTPRICI